MKNEIEERKEVRSDYRWYGIAVYKKIIKVKPKSNEGVVVEYPDSTPVEFPDYLGTKINILV